MYPKRFTEWIKLKEKLHLTNTKTPFLREGDIWWTSVGENVGYEIDGKSSLFSRPVIVLRKLARGFFFGIPTTTQEKKGSWFVPFRQGGVSMNACLHQVRAIDSRRLSSKLGELDKEDFERIRKGFLELI